MITDTKYVQSVESNAPKKGHKIHWSDGKTDNVFDASWLPILEEARRGNLPVNISKEKNDAGYWNIKTLVIGTAQAPPPVSPPPAQPALTTPVVNPVIKAAKELGAVPDKGDKKDRAMAISYAKDLAVAGKIEITDIRKYADKFVEYIVG